METSLAYALAEKGVITRENLAELAVDDLLELAELEPERAASLIMTARAIWFEGADEAEDETAGQVAAGGTASGS